MKKNEKNYNISLDIGTNSVGWAVIDKDNNLLKYKGQNMWGVRLFDTAETAVSRRKARSVRRRLERRRQRINLLQELLYPMISKIDDNFFRRMKETFLHEEDKDFTDFKYLFKDKKDYQKRYESIYHLRNTIVENPEESFDPRLVYLTIHHIIKYRGNFLYEFDASDKQNEEQEFDVSGTEYIEEKFDKIFNIIKENDDVFDISDEIIDNIIDILKDFNKIKKEKKDELFKLIKEKALASKKILDEIIKALLGDMFDLKKILNDDSIAFDNEEGDAKLKFSDKNYEEKEESYLAILEDDNSETLKLLKEIYDWHIMQTLLKGEKSISKSMISRYEKHKKDLRILKCLVKDTCGKEKYDEVFKDRQIYKKSTKNEKGFVNYYNYISHDQDVGKRDIDQLYVYLNKILKEIESNVEKKGFSVSKIYSKEDFDRDYQYCKESIENKDFLLKLRIKDNGAFPYQLHKKELLEIIDNQGKFYPELEEYKEKIIKLFEFRVPYYVGPLNQYSVFDENNIRIKNSPEHAKFSWMKKIEGKENEKILPWNFDYVVDIDKSAEKFINIMTSKCTYLPREDVLPKNSLLYSEYCVLNELNKVKVGGKLIEAKIKNKFIKEVFENKKTVTEKHFRDFLKCESYQNYTDDTKIDGFGGDKKFLATMGSSVDFKKILGDINDNNREMIEQIIYWSTVFEDKKILRIKIEKSPYKFILSKTQINDISSLNYKGWGRLSKKFLTEIYTDDLEPRNIIDLLKSTERDFSNLNLMEIITHKNLSIKEKIEKELAKYTNKDKITYDDIESLAGSPALKRGIWQTIKIVDEIVKFLKSSPSNIYIEFAREDGKKGKRTVSRYERLEKLYKDLKSDDDFKNISEELSRYSADKKALDNKSLYLYFLQNGKCMYSGKTLNINELATYDIDHIIPRSYIKDDSFDNLVLVERIENQRKGDGALDSDVQCKMNSFWVNLNKKGLMTSKKFSNLNKKEFNDEDKQKFINRQLVETRQIIKHVANLLTQAYNNGGTKNDENTKNTQVFSLKANMISDFREKYGLYKIREINDLHHAHDAYICGIICNFIKKIHPNLTREFDYNAFKKYTVTDGNSTGNGTKNRWGYIIIDNIYKIEHDENGEVIRDNNKDIAKVKKILDYKDILITKKTEINNGEFYNQTIFSPKKKITDDKFIPIKNGKKLFLEPKKYGGYSSENDAYSIIVKYKKDQKKEKEERKFIGIPIQIHYMIKSNQIDKAKWINEYAETKLKAKCGTVGIIRDYIYKNQLTEINGNLLYLVSDKEQHNAKEMFLNINSECKKVIDLLFSKEKLRDPQYESFLDDFVNCYIEKLENNFQVYSEVVKKLKKYVESGKYAKLPFVDETKNSIDKQDFIKKIVLIGRCGPSNADLSKYGLTGRFGRLEKSIDIENTIFIDQSITGLRVFRKSIDDMIKEKKDKL